MRLSTAPERDSLDGLAVIHHALDSGARLLDTANVYAHDDHEIGHNERLIAAALASWPGDRSAVEVATKGGLRRPGGRWVADGRAKHLRAACEASLVALGVPVIDLYQLHAVDPRTPIETSVRALARLQAEGLIRRIGLCNVTVAQIEAARAQAEIATVQVSLSPVDDQALRGGVVEYCREHGIRLLAYRPLGGDRRDRLARDPTLRQVAAAHAASPFAVALAWLADLDPAIVPLPGATRVETAHTIAAALTLSLTDQDRRQLDERVPAGRLLRTARAARRPRASGVGEVVLVMGIPGGGKSRVATELVDRGYARLNRDARGGLLRDLVPELARGIEEGRSHWVLDNTYPTRSARSDVIECAWALGLPARCVWVRTSLADAQINAIRRLLELDGRLPDPTELRERGRHDPRFFGPDAQFRYERSLEPPSVAEGFSVVEERAFVREPTPGSGRAILLELDGVLAVGPSAQSDPLEPPEIVIPPDRRDRLARWQREGWALFAQAWRPGVATNPASAVLVQRGFDRARERLGLGLEFGYCPHGAGPPVCWCRKPIPGLVLQFAARRGVAVERCLVVGRGPADRTLAARLGAAYRDGAEFFADSA